MVQKLDLFPSSGDYRETPTLLGHLEKANLNHWRLALPKGPNRVGISFPSPEDGIRSSFWNIMFSSI
jgi:hypothetical protein